MHKKTRFVWLTLALAMGSVGGCTLQDLWERGDQCPPRGESGKMIELRSGTYSFTEGNLHGTTSHDQAMRDKFCVGNEAACITSFEKSFQEQWCPNDYGACVQNTADGANQYFCMPRCDDQHVPCFGTCIDPLHDNEYCGAKTNDARNVCTGYTRCKEGEQKCENGECKNIALFCENEGELRCVNSNGAGTMQKCTGGEWKNDDACKDASGGVASCANEKTCGLCKDESTRCFENPGEPGRMETCEKGAWTTTSACKDASDAPLSCRGMDAEGNPIANKVACGECLNTSDDSCVEDTTTHVGQITKCEKGVLNTTYCDGTSTKLPTGVSLTNYASCKSATECAYCQTGNAECYTNTADNKSYMATCVDGRLETTECVKHHENLASYTYAVSCNASKECGECKENSTKCENTQLGGQNYVCKNGKWEEDTTCSNSCTYTKDPSKTVVISSECGKCFDGENKCEDTERGGVVSHCENGVWVMEADYCKDETGTRNVSCNGEKKACGKCLNNVDKQCKDAGKIGQISTCMDGDFPQGETCRNAQTGNTVSCKSNTACGDCENFETSCVSGMISTCEGGIMSTPVTCPNQRECFDGTRCKQCDGTDYQHLVHCEDKVVSSNPDATGQFYVCMNDMWSALADCTEKCDGNECNVCKPGQNGVYKCIDITDMPFVGHLSYKITCRNGVAIYPSLSNLTDLIGTCD